MLAIGFTGCTDQNNKLTISAPSSVTEGDSFEVTVTAGSNPVNNVNVTFHNESKFTDVNGKVQFSAPELTSDRNYEITVKKEEYTENIAYVLVLNSPKLQVVAPGSVSAGEEFTVLVYDEVGEAIIGAIITFNGETKSTGTGGIALLTAPSQVGSYTITAEYSGYRSASTTVELLRVLINPVANASVDSSEGIEPFTVQFYGSGYDPDGTIETYFWDFDDSETPSEQNPIHTFTNEGTYNVLYRVTDNDGLIGEDTLTIIVHENTYTLTPTDDISVGTSDTGDPQPLYPSAEILYFRNEASDYFPGAKSTTYLKFDMPNIPSIATIKTATIRLYVSVTPTNPIDIKVHQYSDISWTENSFPTQWITIPPYSSASSDTVTVSSGGEWYEWDVTTYIKESLSAGKATLVLDTDPIDFGPVVMAHSKDYYHPNPHFPELIVIIE